VQAASGNARVIAHQTPETEAAAIRGHLEAMRIFKENGVPMHDWPMQTYADLIASYLSLYDSEVTRGKKGPDAELYLDQALTVYAEGHQVETAVRQRWRDRYKDQEVDTAPLLDYLHRNNAVVLSRKGRYQDAVSALDEVLRLLPLKVQTHRMLADIHLAGGNFAAALDTYFLVRVMEPATMGDLSKIAQAAKEIDPGSTPLIADGKGELKLNLNDPLVQRLTRKALLRFKGMLLRSGLLVEAYRIDRVARYSYGIHGSLGNVD
jgi:tetratricopeptide (TPR) repeat protein